MHTSVTLALNPEEVYTEPHMRARTDKAVSEPMNYDNLACPPQSLIDIQNLDRLQFGYPSISTYVPIIHPPDKLLSLDPSWKDCVEGSFAAFDPPKALQPVPAMLSSSRIDDPVVQTTSAAQTAAPKPSLQDPGSPVTTSASPAVSGDPPKDPAGPAKTESVTLPQPSKAGDHSQPPGTSPKPDDPPSQPAKGPSTQGDGPKNPIFVDPASILANPAPTVLFGASGGTTTPLAVAEGDKPSAPLPTVVVDGKSPPDSSNAQPAVNTLPQVSAPPAQQQTPENPVVLGGLSFTPLAEGQGPSPTTALLVEGQTLLQNGPPATIGGNRVLYSAGYVHVGTQSASVPNVASPQREQDPAKSIANGVVFNPIPAASGQPDASPITASVASAGGKAGVVLGSKTVFSGDPAITISGTPVSLGAAGLVVGVVTYSANHGVGSSGEVPVATVGGKTVEYQSGSLAIDGTTLSVGGPAITVSGTPVSLGLSSLHIGNSAVPLPTSYGSGPGRGVPGESPIATVGGQTVQFESGKVAVNGVTLSVGGPPVTVSGTPISLGVSNLLIGTSAVPLPTDDRNDPSMETPVVTVGGQTVGFKSGRVVVGGTTLSIGGSAVTVSGTAVSLGPSGLIVGTGVVPLPTTTGNVIGLGAIILSGLGPIAPTPSVTLMTTGSNALNTSSTIALITSSSSIPAPSSSGASTPSGSRTRTSTGIQARVVLSSFTDLLLGAGSLILWNLFIFC